MAEDVGLSRRAKTITVAGKHAALVVLAHKKGQYGGKVDGNWIISECFSNEWCEVRSAFKCS